MGRAKQYFTNEEKEIAKMKSRIKWNVNHPKEARAIKLIQSYNDNDEKHGFEKGDLTTKWIVEHIFTKPCAHCGKEGWNIIGCNRLDNTKPHTMDNVEPCCAECNNMMWGKEASKKVYQYTLDGKLLCVYDSIFECHKNGYDPRNVSKCCNGTRNKHKGYRWSFG